MKDKDDEDILTLTMRAYKRIAYDLFIDDNPPVFVGIDWAAGYGRGHVIRREGNVTHVRFKS